MRKHCNGSTLTRTRQGGDSVDCRSQVIAGNRVTPRLQSESGVACGHMSNSDADPPWWYVVVAALLLGAGGFFYWMLSTGRRAAVAVCTGLSMLLYEALA